MISEHGTQDWTAGDLRRLDRLARGTDAVVAAVPEAHAALLARHGIVTGSPLTVEAHAPFGGPIVVLVGRARVALGRDVAAGIAVAGT